MAITAADLQDRYDEPNLSCVVQPVAWSTPWPRLPVPSDFRSGTLRRTIPQVDWVFEQFETQLRTDLTAWMKDVKGIDVGIRIMELPMNFLSFMYRNLFTNIRDENPSVFMSRLDHELTGAVEAFPAYWVGYHLAGFLMKDYEAAVQADQQYRYKQLYDLQEVFGTAMVTILADNPNLTRGNHVIVAYTSSVGERQTVFVGQDNLVKYLNSGKTVKTLTDQWLLNQTNPTV